MEESRFRCEIIPPETIEWQNLCIAAIQWYEYKEK